MSYKNKTPYFGIPVVGDGDRISETEEMKRALIIENQLIAASKGVKCAVFEDGEYFLIKDSEQEYSVILEATGENVSACGILNGGYFEGKPRLVWPNLEVGRVHWLYIQWLSDLFVNKTKFRLLSSTIEKNLTSGKLLLMAKIDLTGNDFSMDPYPDGKVYAQDIVIHANDNTNPHGRELVQDSLLIRKGIKVLLRDQSENDAAIEIEDLRDGRFPTLRSEVLSFEDKYIFVDLTDRNNRELKTENSSIIGAINELAKEQSIVIEFRSGGEDGKKVPIEGGKILAVFVSQIWEGKMGKLGEYAIEYFDDKFVFYNEGDPGILLKAIVFIGNK